MFKLFEFLLRRINFILFVILELLAFWLIVQNNPFHSAAFFTSSNALAGSISAFTAGVKEYFNLQETNRLLASENAYLKQKLQQIAMQKEAMAGLNAVGAHIHKYHFVAAKVINNSTLFTHNYITINKGIRDSVLPGMGVVCPRGIVGKVKACSQNYATVTSVLHKDMKISSKLKKQQVIGSVQWEGSDATQAILMYIPRHISVHKGDTVVTSEYNSVFPEGEMIGTVKDIEIRGDESFYRIKVALNVDFYAINYVYVIKNKHKNELDTLESNIINERNERK